MFDAPNDPLVFIIFAVVAVLILYSWWVCGTNPFYWYSEPDDEMIEAC